MLGVLEPGPSLTWLSFFYSLYKTKVVKFRPLGYSAFTGSFSLSTNQRRVFSTMNESMINRGERTNHAQYWKFEQKWFVLDRDLIFQREKVFDYQWRIILTPFSILCASGQIIKSKSLKLLLFPFLSKNRKKKSRARKEKREWLAKRGKEPHIWVTLASFFFFLSERERESDSSDKW